MVQFTCVPKPVANWLHVLRPMFHHRHHLVFCWLLVCQAIYQEKATITGLARLAPHHIAEWHLRRLLTAAYWNWRILLWWFADQVTATLPPPEDGVCYLVVDSTIKDKTGSKHPLAKKGRLNEYAPYVFGLHVVVIMLQWGNYRIPVDFEIVRRKDHPQYRSDNALFRRMLVRFRPTRCGIKNSATYVEVEPATTRPTTVEDYGHRRTQTMRIGRQITRGGSLADSARPRRGRSGRMGRALGGLLVLLSMSLIGGCKEAAMDAAPPEPPEVQVTPVVQKDVPIYSEWVGTTVGYVTAQIRARVSGYLMSQQYTEGAFVKTGDLLFRIDPRPYQATVDQDEATLGQAQAQLEQSRAQLAQANAQVEQAKAQVAQAMAAVTQAQANQRRTELDVNRYTPLVKDGSVSQQEFDNAVQNNLANKAAVASARANVDVARANLLRMQANAKQAQANITTAQANVAAAKAALYNAQLNARWTLVTSPIDGLAGLRNIDLGEVVTQDQTVLTTVSTVDPIYVDFQLSEDQYLRYKTAAAGTFRRVEDIPLELILTDGTVFPQRGRFNALDRDVSLTTGTFRVRSEFPNPEALLRPGQFAKVRAAARLRTGALLVPQRAVQDLQGTFQVGVVGPDNTVEIRPVKVGPRVGTLWVINEGLKPGEQVIVAGLQNVRAGAVVKASPVDAEPAGAEVQSGAASTTGAPAPTGASSQRHPSN